MPEKLPPLIMVEWVDACSNNRAWVPGSDAVAWAKDPCMCVTVGFLIHEDKDVVALASSLGFATGELGGLWQIPKGMIKKRKKVKW